MFSPWGRTSIRFRYSGSGLFLVPLGPEIAADSCFLPGGFHGDPADRQIVATARRLGAAVVTLEQAILDYGAKGWVSVVDPR